jgi:hypothetical protein
MIDPTEGTVLKDQPGFGEGAIAEEGGEQDAMSPAGTESPDGMPGDMEMEMDIEEEDSPD